MIGGLERGDEALGLSSESIASDGHGQGAQRVLRRVSDFLREENRSRANTPGRFNAYEFHQRLPNFIQFEQVTHGGAFAPGQNTAGKTPKVFSTADFDRSRT